MVMANCKEANASATVTVGILKSFFYFLTCAQKYLARQVCVVSVVDTHPSNIFVSLIKHLQLQATFLTSLKKLIRSSLEKINETKINKFDFMT